LLAAAEEPDAQRAEDITDAGWFASEVIRLAQRGDAAKIAPLLDQYQGRPVVLAVAVGIIGLECGRLSRELIAARTAGPRNRPPATGPFVLP
jgi:hypothetical protein